MQSAQDVHDQMAREIGIAPASLPAPTPQPDPIALRRAAARRLDRDPLAEHNADRRTCGLPPVDRLPAWLVEAEKAEYRRALSLAAATMPTMTSGDAFNELADAKRTIDALGGTEADVIARLADAIRKRVAELQAKGTTVFISNEELAKLAEQFVDEKLAADRTRLVDNAARSVGLHRLGLVASRHPAGWSTDPAAQ